MTHLPYIVGSYGLALALAFGFGISAWTRTTRARKRLAALDTRREQRREFVREIHDAGGRA